jgi:hypothetical protein
MNTGEINIEWHGLSREEVKRNMLESSALFRSLIFRLQLDTNIKTQQLFSAPYLSSHKPARSVTNLLLLHISDKRNFCLP